MIRSAWSPRDVVKPLTVLGLLFVMLMLVKTPEAKAGTSLQDDPRVDPALREPTAISLIVHQRPRQMMGVVGTAGVPSDGAWTRTVCPTLPPARVTHSAIFDGSRGRMVVFGGGGDVFKNDTWVLPMGDPSDWSALRPLGVPPSPRRLQSAIYDPVRDRMIVFGGANSAGVLNDVWELSFGGSPTWTRLLAAGAVPKPRCAHAAIYDPIGDRMIVYGGWDGISPTAKRLGDVWALSLSGTPTWSEIAATGGPGARSSHRAIYDAPRKRMLVFGGTDPSFHNDVWALPLTGAPVWSQVSVSGSAPAPREECSAVYDPVGDRMVLFGGYDEEYYFDDAWILDLHGAPAWRPCVAKGEAPPALWGHSAVYDPTHDCMALFGGYMYNVTWVLHFARAAVNHEPDCSGAFAVNARIRQPNRKLVPVEIGGVTDADGDSVAITVTGITQDEPVVGRSDRTCPDAVIRNGAALVRAERSGDNGRVYRVAFQASDGHGGVSEGAVNIWVAQGNRCVDDGQTVNSLGSCAAGGAAFAVMPEADMRVATAGQGTMTIEFALPEAGDATLGIYDLSGRRVASLLGARRDAGVHAFEWKTAGVPRGVYFARLKAGSVAITRTIVIRE